jgi:hypothetical protein
VTTATHCRRAALAAAAGLLASISGAAGADTSGGPSFASGPPIPAGPDPVSVAVADFNGDGQRDLAVANRGYARGLKILLGDSAGGFAAAGPAVKAAGEPQAVASADFDGDGNADLALASQGPNTIRVLLGDGAGRVSAAPGSPVVVTGDPLSVSVADLNGDGRADLIVPSYGEKQRTVTALLGDGSGRFVPAPGSPVVVNSRSGWSSLAVADFNGDAKPDLVGAGSESHMLTVLLGDGTGRLGTSSTVPSEYGATSLVAADFNDDGRQDLAVASQYSKQGFTKPLLTILLGNGAAQFHAAAPSMPVGSGENLASADFNGDGKVDLAAAAGDQVDVLLGNGAGGFREAPDSPFTGVRPWRIAAADFNGDAKVDILALSGAELTWWPRPSVATVLLQTATTPQVLPGRPARAGRAVVSSTRQPIVLLAADAKRMAALVTFKANHTCDRVVIWSAPGAKPRSIGARACPSIVCSGTCAEQLAIGAGQVAWVTIIGGNGLELRVLAAKLAAGPAKEIELETNDAGATWGPGGDWLGQLLGGGSVLAYNRWQVVCVDDAPGYCDGWDFAKKKLVRVAAGQGLVVRRAPYPLQAVGGGRMAVESAGAVAVLAPNGSRVSTVRAVADDPPRAVALSSTRLAIERTFTLDLYDPRRGGTATSLPLGPAAALQLIGVNTKLALLRERRRLVLVRLLDGKLISLPLGAAATKGFVAARLTDAGLFYAYNRPRAAAKGRIVFEPTSSLLARF